jgi:heme a synthase
MATHVVGRATRRIFLATLVAQIVIVVTGGAVRLTGSGLGCPTWPQCAEDSYVPLPAQAEAQLHKWIEFGNRLLTFVLALVVLIAIVAAIRHVRSHRGTGGRILVILTLAQLLGIVAQAVLGGITVLTDLHPIPVAGHFILSIVLITVAATLHFLVSAAPLGARREVLRLIQAITVIGFVVIVLGTIVTGSGPHAGDEKARRFGFDPRLMSWLHADAVILLMGLLIAVLIAMRLTDGSPLLQRRGLILFGVALAQGIIGYVQYFTGLPEIVVGAHLLGACLFWVYCWRFFLSARSPRLP